MMDSREEQRAKGTNANMNEARQAADPVLRIGPPGLIKWHQNEAKAKCNKCRRVSEIENQEREAQEACKRQLLDIQNFIQQNTPYQKILDEDIYIIDVNSLCYTGNTYVIGEVTVLRFNIRSGIKDNIHELIKPIKIPYGYYSDVKRACKELGLDVPQPDEPVEHETDVSMLLLNIIDYMKKGDGTKVLPPLYTMPDKTSPAQDFMSQLCQTAHDSETVFRVHNLDVLFFHVIDSLKKHNYEGFPNQSYALALLKRNPFLFTMGLSCEHHKKVDRTMECTKSHVTTWVYTILDKCCPLAGVKAIPGLHSPPDINIDDTQQDGQQDFRILIPEARPLPKRRDPPSCHSRDASYYNVLPSTSHHSTRSPMVRRFQPLRNPSTELLSYQLNMVLPQMMEVNLPPLNLNAGRGAARKLSFDMNNLNLDK